MKKFDGLDMCFLMLPGIRPAIAPAIMQLQQSTKVLLRSPVLEKTETHKPFHSLQSFSIALMPQQPAQWKSYRLSACHCRQSNMQPSLSQSLASGAAKNST